MFLKVLQFYFKIELSNQKTFLVQAGFELWILLLDAHTLTESLLDTPILKFTTLMFTILDVISSFFVYLAVWLLNVQAIDWVPHDLFD